jgi:hypothetical protein
MPARRLTDTHLVIGAGVLTVLLGGAAAFIGGPGEAGADRASSFSAGAQGGKAAFYTLKELGYSIERSFEPMTGIQADPAQTTIVLTGAIGPSEQDRRALREFVERGGVVLLVGAQGANFLRVSVSDAASAFPGTAGAYPVAVPSPLGANVREISMARTGARSFGPSYVALVSVSADEPLVTTARVGEGRVIWWAAATPLANAHISSADNLQLLLNLVGAPGVRNVLWDEHYHGHTRSLWSYAAGTPLPLIGAQAGIIALAAFAAYSRRRGPVRAKTVDARTSPLEFIDMVRALYQRAGAAGAAVAAARARFRRAVTTTCGIPADSTDDALARTAASKLQMDVQPVAELLAAADHAVRDPDLNGAEALKVIQGLQGLTQKF